MYIFQRINSFWGLLIMFTIFALFKILSSASKRDFSEMLQFNRLGSFVLYVLFCVCFVYLINLIASKAKGRNVLAQVSIYFLSIIFFFIIVYGMYTQAYGEIFMEECKYTDVYESYDKIYFTINSKKCEIRFYGGYAHTDFLQLPKPGNGTFWFLRDTGLIVGFKMGGLSSHPSKYTQRSRTGWIIVCSIFCVLTLVCLYKIYKIMNPEDIPQTNKLDPFLELLVKELIDGDEIIFDWYKVSNKEICVDLISKKMKEMHEPIAKEFGRGAGRGRSLSFRFESGKWNLVDEGIWVS